MYILKRDGRKVEYDENKIRQAISKAFIEIDGEVTEDGMLLISKISKDMTDNVIKDGMTVEEIQDEVENHLMSTKRNDIAKAYILYRDKRRIARSNDLIKNVKEILAYDTSNEVLMDNSNKNGIINSTQRDLMAGEVSKFILDNEMLPKKIVEAHEKGIIHYHDRDYGAQTNEFNCSLVNIQDMLDNGTVMNGKMVESPKGFQTACTVITQIMAHVASNQYGGQSVAIKHLGKYLRRTYDKAYKKYISLGWSEEDSRKLALIKRQEELESGVQTIQYQINTLMTTNGQAPFVTLFMQIEEGFEYEEEVALIIEEILKQRIKGIKNKDGVYVTPAFPKLIYVVDKCNCFEGGKYDYLSRLAAECSNKRMYPDYISAEKFRENYEGQVFSSMGCRSHLSPWKDENGNYKWEGRFNQGVVSLNLPQIAILNQGNEEGFWEMLDERLEVCFEALMCRHKLLEGTRVETSPVHWQYGAIARLKDGETIDKLLHGGYSTISLGYIGVYETTLLMRGVSHTDKKGTEFALKLMNTLRAACDKWKKETGIGFGLYGSPAENLCYRFAKIDEKLYGDLIPKEIYEDIVGKGYYTNSYHVDVREKIDAFSKLSFEAPFHKISNGGCLSYVEIPSMKNNIEAIETLINFIYHNVQYAEFNSKSDYCYECGFEGEIILKDNDWECPVCGNRDHNKMNVTRRTCGYLGENFWNTGKTKEIGQRKLHL